MNTDPMEDDGFRNNLAVSRAARSVFGLRHMDVDLYQLCRVCRKPQLFIESTSKVGFKNTRDLRILGTMCDAPTLLIKHAFNDVDHEHPISLYLWYPGSTGREDPADLEVEDADWDRFRQVMRMAANIHQCDGPGSV